MQAALNASERSRRLDNISFTAAASGNSLSGCAERGQPSRDRAREFSWRRAVRAAPATAGADAGRHILPVVSKSFDRIDQALGEVIKEKGRPICSKVALPTSLRSPARHSDSA